MGWAGWRARDAAGRPRLERKENQEEEGNLPPPCGHAGLVHLPTWGLPDQGTQPLADRGHLGAGLSCSQRIVGAQGHFWGVSCFLGGLTPLWAHLCIHTCAHTDMFIREKLIKHIAPTLAPVMGNTAVKKKTNRQKNKKQRAKPTLRALTFLAKDGH